jgi:hypothetical protein
MDVTTQTKLTRDEWNSIEIPVPTEELSILQFIQQGFHDPQKKENAMKSMYTYLKIDPNPALDHYLCQTFTSIPMKKNTVPLKKADQIRIQSKQVPDTVYEKLLLSLCEKKEFFHVEWMLRLAVSKPNPHVMTYVRECLAKYTPDMVKWTKDAVQLLERNPYVGYKDRELYAHQKELFTVAKEEGPKLILYVAPTGTGKTMSPIGLAEKYHIIFVCAAKHVSMALAKMCLSLQIKVAFALGCKGEEDIKLHYSAAIDYIKNKKTGGIAKVDNTNGAKVEVMISDVQSYLYAMHYMLKFQPKEKILLYWDEPTIAMDVEEHPLHPIIHRLWKENVIPNVVLSSATLPALDYRAFTTSTIYTIKNGESNKTIQLVNPNHQLILPHHLPFEEIPKVVEHLKSHGDLLKYVDLGSVVAFLRGRTPFTKATDLTIPAIKQYYVSLLATMTKEEWEEEQKRRIQVPSTIRFCSEDAWTCSYGPTIYIAEDVQKIASYCLKTASIPASLLQDLTKQLSYNQSLTEKMTQLEKDLEDSNKDAEKEKKMTDNRVSPEVKKIQEELKRLQASVHTIALPNGYIPNTYEHLLRYDQVDKLPIAFTSNVDTSTIEKVLTTDIDASWKVLLMMGIGVFSAEAPPRYMELVKEQVMKQKMYVILATTDYIYGTNYQFANLYLGKDMRLSQEKLIQTLGRVGRGKQVPYSIRFRDDAFASILFTPQESPESRIMTRLFS